MQHAAHHATQAIQPSSPSAPEPDDLQTKRFESYMTRLWQVMAERYDRQWTNRWGESWNGQDWRGDLHDLTKGEFVTGVKLDLERKSEWAPSCAQFRALAISARPSNVPAHQPFQRALPKPRSHTVAARWKAFQQAEGIKSWGFSQDEIEEILRDVDVAAMRAQVEAGCEAIREGRAP